MSDFTHVHKISFQVDKTDILSEKDFGVGAERLCYRCDDRKSRERVVVWDDKAKTYELEVVSGLPYDKAHFTVSVTDDPEDDEKCTVSGQFEYTVAGGPIGMLIDHFYLKATLEKVFELYMAGVEYHLRTGETVGKDFNLQMLKDIEYDE